MKKIVYLFAAILPALAFTSCDDNEDIPDVDFNVAISGATFSDNEIYVVAGDTLSIDGVAVINNEQGKGATIPYVNYYFDNFFIGQNAVEPYNFDIAINDNVPIGRHVLEMTAPVFAADKEPGYAIITYKVNVVESAEDLPQGGLQTDVTTAHVTENNSNS